MNKKHQEDLVKLCSFIKDRNLAILESKLQEFNIFSILNLNRQEIRHSAMLAWLFNPQANHGLSVTPIKILLLQLLDSLPEDKRTKALLNISKLNPTGINVTTESDTKTGRIDILIEGDSFVIGIENKIDTKDAIGQLPKYAKYMGQQFPHKLNCLIYLTPGGAEPQEADNAVILLSYKDIVSLIDNLLISIPRMAPQVHSLLLQYQQLIQRDITMEDKKIQELCSKLYQEHKEAIETILEYKMDFQAKIGNILKGEFKKGNIPVQAYRDSKCYFNFSPRSWEEYTCMQVDDGIWLKGCTDLVLFEVLNNNKEVNIKLIVGPTNNKEQEQMKQKLLAKLPNTSKYQKSGNKWTTIYSYKLLQYEKLQNATNEEIENQFKNNLDQWLNNEYPELVAQIEEIMKQLQQDYERENAQ